MLHKAMSRRSFLAKAGLASSAALLAGCQPKVVEKIVERTVVVTQDKLVKETVVVKEAVEVEKEVTRVVEKAVAGSPAGQVVTLRMVTRGGKEGDYGRIFGKKFSDEHPNIEVKTEDVVYAELQQKQELGFISGTMQDVVYSATKWYDYVCYKGLYLTLDGYINANPYNFEDYYPSCINACVFEGKIYGLPGDVHPHSRELLLWNRKLYEEAGFTTWPLPIDMQMEEVKEIALKSTQPDKGIFGTKFTTGTYYDFDCVLLMPFGTSLLNEDGSKLMMLEDPKIEEATKWYLEMVKAHATPYRADMLEGQDMFYAGRMVSNNTGLSGLVGIDAATEGGKLWEWGWTFMPLGPAGRGSQLFVNQWAVGSSSKYPAEAYELVSYLTSAEVGIWATVNQHKQPNGSRSAWYSKEVAEKEPAFAACAPWLDDDSLKRFPMPKNLRFQEFEDVWENLTAALFYGEKEWDEVAPELTKKGQEILDQPRP